jgi:hypothetical protein
MLWLNKSSCLLTQAAGLSLCLRAFKDARMIQLSTHEINSLAVDFTAI